MLVTRFTEKCAQLMFAQMHTDTGQFDITAWLMSRIIIFFQPATDLPTCNLAIRQRTNRTIIFTSPKSKA